MTSAESVADLVNALNESGIFTDGLVVTLALSSCSKINDAYMATTSTGSRYFVKHHIADARMNQQACLKMFEAEMAGLSALRQIGTFRVPQPIGAGLTRDGAFLVTEYIQLEPLRDERKLGRQLAAMHMVRGPQMFGFDMDNYIGTTPQPNSWTESWVAFLHMRLKFQFDQAPFADETRNQAEELLANLPTIFHDMADMVPSMIHGDMWFNNCATDEHGDSVVFDPAVYWGHHESELGSMKMFGGFGDELYEAYHECIPKAPGFDKRVQLYELYHLVNHLNMFGVAYLHCCTRLIESIHAQLSAN